MKRFLRVAILVPVALLLVFLSVANRHRVTFSLDPFNPENPAFRVELPLFWLVFIVLALGILIGGVATWLGQAHWRHEARLRERETKTLRREIETARSVAAASRPQLPAR